MSVHMLTEIWQKINNCQSLVIANLNLFVIDTAASMLDYIA